VLGPLTLGCIWLGGWPFLLLLLLALAGLGWEWVRLCGFGSTNGPGNWAASVFGIGLLPAAAALAWVGWVPAGLVLLGLGAAVLRFRAVGGVAAAAVRAGPSAAWLVGGLFGLGCAGMALALLRQDGLAGHSNLLGLVLLVWASDIGAYLAGRLLGGPKLAPRISPAKTWSGAAGGLAAALAMGLGWALLVGTTFWGPIIVALLLGLATQGGDLLESGAKRRFGVKDSSALIPGHGGLLDRLDGLLAAAPVAALLAWSAGPGRPIWDQSWR
jgi:phosphatidate cytidylyltransferase